MYVRTQDCSWDWARAAAHCAVLQWCRNCRRTVLAPKRRAAASRCAVTRRVWALAPSPRGDWAALRPLLDRPLVAPHRIPRWWLSAWAANGRHAVACAALWSRSISETSFGRRCLLNPPLSSPVHVLTRCHLSDVNVSLYNTFRWEVRVAKI